VLDQQHGDRWVEREQQIGQQVALTGRKAGGWLVEHQDPGLARQRHTDLQLTLLTMRERTRHDVEPASQANPLRDRSPSRPQLPVPP